MDRPDNATNIAMSNLTVINVISNTTNMNTISISTISPDTKISESIVPVALQCLFAVGGNILALLFLISSSKTHKWKSFYRLVLGLVITDLAGATCHFPTALYRYASDFTFDFPHPLCDFLSFDFSFAFMSSALIVCAMSFDRHLAINYPFRYATRTRGRKTNIILLSIWISTAIICSFHFFGLGSSKLYYPGSWCFLNFVSSDVKDRINTYVYCSIGTVILLSTVVVNIVAIISMCRKSRLNTIKRKNKKQQDIFVIVLLILIVCTFGICWTPLMVTMFINASEENPVSGPTELLVIRLAITNGIVNPWIYIFVRRENFLAVVRFVTKLRRRFDESDTENHGASVVTISMEPNESDTT